MATQVSQDAKDHWSAEAYHNAASFVPKLTATVVKYLDPQQTDRILDIGCGDGVLTAQIAEQVSQGQVHGLDASSSFIEHAKTANCPSNCSYTLQDCTRLDECEVIDGSWNKVFSNAALHWILRNETTRNDVFKQVFKALEPGGHFVFEMGGKGNVGEVYAALLAALVHHGVPLAQAREASPWFFPSTAWAEAALTDAGFIVELCELEYRPTRVTDAESGGGFEGWLRLMAAQFFDVVEPARRESAIQFVMDILQTVHTKEEDGSQWIGNVRLRAVARKPSTDETLQ